MSEHLTARTHGGSLKKKKATPFSLTKERTATFTVTPNAGLSAGTYTAAVQVDGTLEDPVTASFILEVNAPPTYTISVSAAPAAGGTVSGGGSCQSGTSVTLTVTASPGYCFVGWVDGNGSAVSNSATYTFTANSNRTLTARFEAFLDEDSDAPTYSVSLPGAVAGGEITAKKLYADGGETYRFTVTPDEDYELASLSAADGAGREIKLPHEDGGAGRPHSHFSILLRLRFSILPPQNHPPGN